MPSAAATVPVSWHSFILLLLGKVNKFRGTHQNSVDSVRFTIRPISVEFVDKSTQSESKIMPNFLTLVVVAAGT
jgi:hypothetical protein